MKKDTTDFEVLMELMSLISKYDINKIERVIQLLKNPNMINDTINIFERSINILKLYNENSEYCNTPKAHIADLSMSIVIKKIRTILEDKNAFKNIREIDSFIKRHVPNGINTSKRTDMIEMFCIFLFDQQEEKQEEILSDIQEFLLIKKNKDSNHKNDLKSWSDIIMNSHE